MNYLPSGEKLFIITSLVEAVFTSSFLNGKKGLINLQVYLILPYHLLFYLLLMYVTKARGYVIISLTNLLNNSAEVSFAFISKLFRTFFCSLVRYSSLQVTV